MPGYDWTDSSGNVDASQSGYNYSSGTSHGNSNNNNNNNNNYYSNPDDNYDDSWESQPNDYEEPYTPPDQIYGPGSATPGETGYGYTTLHPNTIENILAGSGLSESTLAAFGYHGGGNFPNELLKMILEGSIVGANEAMYGSYTDLDPNKPGIQTGVGTFSDLEAGIHPMFPGGMQQYYDVMRMPSLIDISNSGGGGGYGYGYGYGRGRSGGISGRAAQPTIDPYNPEFGKWGQSTVQGDFIRSLKNRGGIISIVR